jgi:hypothetical protein
MKILQEFLEARLGAFEIQVVTESGLHAKAVDARLPRMRVHCTSHFLPL